MYTFLFFEILRHILSMLPLKFALATVTLSIRWSRLWNNNGVVKHGTSLEDIDCAVGNFLLKFDTASPLKYPQKLEFHFRKCRILLATIGLKNKLHLDFSNGENLEFSREFKWNLLFNGTPISQAPTSTFFVKTLNLTSVSNLTNAIVSSLISNFQFLENLTIANCRGLTSLHIDVVSRLLSLTVLDCPQLAFLNIEAYELKSLRYRGLLCFFHLSGVLYLEDAMLDFREGPWSKYFNYLNFFDPLLRAITDVKLLTLPGWMFKEIVSRWLFSEYEELRFSRLKDLWWIDNSVEEHKIEALFSFMKFCLSLERLFITIDPASYYITSSTIGDCLNEVSEPAKMAKLKLVKVEGFTDDKDIIYLKEHLQEIFNKEPRIVAATHGSPSRCLIRIPRYLRKDNWNMKGTKSRKRNKFVEEIEDNIGLCSKHEHMLL